MNKVQLIDVDSKIPNLALMKISAYHKSIGDKVGFHISDHNIVYASIVFSKNSWKGNGIKKMYPNAKVFVGGSGYDLKSKLPDKIEKMFPDYDLYPSGYSQGFTTRGCIRNCSFCIVRSKEGYLSRYQHPKDFHDERFDTIMIMDNNWLADSNWFFETSNWIIDHDLKVIEHGLDIRLVDDKIADQLLKLKIKKYHFAFDFIELEAIVREKINLLKEVGINLRTDTTFYVYCDSDLDYDNAVYRCNVLRDLGTNAFLMWNCNAKKTRRIKNLIHWCNRKMLYWKIPFEEYLI